MGDAKKDDLRVGFDSRLKLSFVDSKISSDAGLLVSRELDEALGLAEIGVDTLVDSRQGRNKQHQLLPLLEIRDVSTRRSDCHAEMVRGNPGPGCALSNPAAVCRWWPWLSGLACGKSGFQGRLTHPLRLGVRQIRLSGGCRREHDT